MACDPVTFHNVSAAVFKCLKNELEEAGVMVPTGASGTISGNGVEAEFKWDKAAKTLTVIVTSKPIFVSCGYVTGKIHDSVVACGGQ